MVWATAVMIVEPLGVPTTIHNLPSFSTMVGVILLSILFWGAILLASAPTRPNIFGTPGLALKSSISLFRKNPSSSQYTLEPYAPFKVVVTATAFPWASTMEKWVVSVLS